MVDERALTVLITGASRGIGFATAQAFLARGARVAYCARDPGRLAESERELAAFGEVWAQLADVRTFDTVSEFVSAACERFGDIDVLINNAGVLCSGPFAQEDPNSLAELIDVNVKGVLHMTRAVLPTMLARGSGVVINIASGAGLDGFADLAAYCASKFAVVGFSESLDLEVTRQGVLNRSTVRSAAGRQIRPATSGRSDIQCQGGRRAS